MNRKTLPKLKTIELSRYVMDLLMVQEGNESHVSEPRVRVIWHLLFFSIIGIAVVSVLALPILRQIFPGSPAAAACWRAFNVLFWIYTVILLALLSARHYRHLLRTGKDLKFGNILFFYVSCVIFFAHLYNGLFYLEPSLFVMTDPVVQPTPNLMSPGLRGSLLFFDFVVYSASTIVSLDYPRIHTASVAVSICNVFQVFFGIGIVTLLVATFIQKVELRKPE